MVYNYFIILIRNGYIDIWLVLQFMWKYWVKILRYIFYCCYFNYYDTIDDCFIYCISKKQNNCSPPHFDDEQWIKKLEIYGLMRAL